MTTHQNKLRAALMKMVCGVSWVCVVVWTWSGRPGLARATRSAGGSGTQGLREPVALTPADSECASPQLTYYVNEEGAVAGRRRGNDEAFLPEDADTDVPLNDVERLRQPNGIRIQGQSYTQCDGSATTAGAPVDKEMSDDERQNLKDEAEKRVTDWFEAEEDRDTETHKKVEKLKDEEVDFLLTHKCGNKGWDTAKFHQGGVAKLPGNPHDLDFPGICMNDNGNGFRQAFGSNGLSSDGMFNGETVPMPAAGNIGSTFDVEYAFAHGLALGIMHNLHGGNYILGPGVQVWQNPHGGRLWEYMSGEDPTLGVVLAGAYGVAPKLQNVGCTWKHYVDNNEENGRFFETDNVKMPKEALFDIYWKPFIAGMSVGGQSVMCSYSSQDGKSDCANKELLGFLHEVTERAFIVSDWGGTGGNDPGTPWVDEHGKPVDGGGKPIKDDQKDAKQGMGYDAQGKYHGNGTFLTWWSRKIHGKTEYAYTKEDNDARSYYDAGLDLEQPAAMVIKPADADETRYNIRHARKDDKRKAIHRIFAAVEDIGWQQIDNSHHTDIGDDEAKKYGGRTQIMTESKSVAIALAAEAMVLLKNTDNVLPLKSGRKLKKVINCDTHPKKGISKFSGGKRMTFDPNSKVNPEESYDMGSGEVWQEIPKVSDGLKGAGITIDDDADVSLLCLDGSRGAEGLQREDLRMPWFDDADKALENNGKLIVYMGVPGQVEIGHWSKKADAIVSSVFLGYGVGPALGQLLTGKHNPSGHLSHSIVKRAEHIKAESADYAKSDGVTGHEIGYRRLQKYDNEAEYEFGWGIPLEGSWEKFEMEVVEHDVELRRISFCVTNGNEGGLYGDDKIQEWPSPTVQFFAKIGDRKWKELIAFRKIRFLGPGKKRCSFVFYDPVAQWNKSDQKFDVVDFELFHSFNGYSTAKKLEPKKTSGEKDTKSFDRKGYWRHLRKRYMLNAIQVGAETGNEVAQHLPLRERTWKQLWRDWVRLGDGTLGQIVREEDPY